jgi:hypothetical protein
MELSDRHRNVNKHARLRQLKKMRRWFSRATTAKGNDRSGVLFYRSMLEVGCLEQRLSVKDLGVDGISPEAVKALIA